MRRSFARPRREGTAWRGTSTLRARATYTTPARVRPRNTMIPAQVPIASAASAITAKYPTVSSRKR
jgi:hypothetical protein